MISIHLALEDKEYQKRLAERLAWHNISKEIYSHEENERIEENAIKESDSKKEFKNQKELWLISEGTKIDTKDKVCLLFQKEPTQKEGECFCYQPFSKIQKKIIEHLYRFCQVEKRQAEEEAEILYLYSPFGGIGVSGFSYQLAKYYSRKERVLLVSLDSYHQFSGEFIPFRLSEVLFYWETVQDINLADFCIQKEGVDILHGPNSTADLEVLRARKKEDFIRLLKDGGYQKIIIDLSSSGMENWCQPMQEGETFFVIKKREEKWKAFVTNHTFPYLAVDRENAIQEMVRNLEGGEQGDVSETISGNY